MCEMAVKGVMDTDMDISVASNHFSRQTFCIPKSYKYLLIYVLESTVYLEDTNF